jgi:CheY-like chemotaxis protein
MVASTSPKDEVAYMTPLSAEPGHARSVLVVEDDPQIRNFIRRLLESRGYIAHEAENGREALRILERNGADAIITDVFMPEEDGIEFIRKIRSTMSYVPVIAISGGGSYKDSSILEAAHALGADEIIEKPFEIGDLIAALERVIDRGR